MLYKNRIDIVLFNDLVFQTMTNQLKLNFDKVKILLEANDMNTHLSIAFSKGTDPLLIERYKKAFQQLKYSGKLQRIKNKWGIKDD